MEDDDQKQENEEQYNEKEGDQKNLENQDEDEFGDLEIKKVENDEEKAEDNQNKIEEINNQENIEDNQNKIEEINNQENIEDNQNKIEEGNNTENKEKIPFFKEEPKKVENKKLKPSKIYITKTSELNGKTLYHIKGDCIPKNSEVIRRYRDFDSLYKKLLHNWPGIFLPPIPPKIYFSSSTDKKVIDERTYQLESFLQNSAEMDCISECEEFTLFLNHQISDSDLFQTEMKKVAPYDLKKISENYTKYFSKYKTMKKNKDLDEDRLDIYMGYVNDFIDKLKEYRKQVVVFGDIDKKKIYRETRVITHFTEFEKLGMNHFINNDQSLLYFHNNQYSLEDNKAKYDKLVNHPYLLLSNWIRLKELELNSIKDKLNEYMDWTAKKVSYNIKLKDMQQKSNDVNNGKVGFFEKIFVKGDIQKLKAKYENELKTLTDETNYINNIVVLIKEYIAVEFYKYFEKLTQGFYYMVKTFASIQKENSILAMDIWLKVKNGKEDDEKLNDKNDIEKIEIKADDENNEKEENEIKEKNENEDN